MSDNSAIQANFQQKWRGRGIVWQEPDTFCIFVACLLK